MNNIFEVQRLFFRLLVSNWAVSQKLTSTTGQNQTRWNLENSRNFVFELIWRMKPQTLLGYITCNWDRLQVEWREDLKELVFYQQIGTKSEIEVLSTVCIHTPNPFLHLLHFIKDASANDLGSPFSGYWIVFIFAVSRWFSKGSRQHHFSQH